MAFFDDLRAYREGVLAQGFWALQIYRLGHLRYRFNSKLIRIPLAVVNSAKFFLVSLLVFQQKLVSA